MRSIGMRLTYRENRYTEKKSDIMRANAAGVFLKHEFAKHGSVNQSRGRVKMAIQVWVRNHGVVQLQVSRKAESCECEIIPFDFA